MYFDFHFHRFVFIDNGDRCCVYGGWCVFDNLSQTTQQIVTTEILMMINWRLAKTNKLCKIYNPKFGLRTGVAKHFSKSRPKVAYKVD